MNKLWLLPLLCMGLYAADITGRWSGAIAVDDPSSGVKVNTPVKAQFDQKDHAVSGRIGRVEDEQTQPISNAKLDGNSLVFDVRSEETAGVVRFSLKLVSDDRIEGEMKGAGDAGPFTGKVTLQKVK
jgi:hypothetical protein